ncbi:MAG: ferric reductase-like transmembrane domain-containing protein, partial [Gammaproteobacteria bacterium]
MISGQPQYSAFEQHWFAAVLIYTIAPLAMVASYAPPRGIDYWWDLAMALGAVAGVGLALLPLLSARWWVGQQRTTGFLRLVQTVHRELSYVALGCAVAHVAILLILEGRVVEYLKLSAESAMLAGLFGILLVVALVISSRYRENLRIGYRSWRTWHGVLSIAAIGLIGWHLLGAGYYFDPGTKGLGLIALLSAPTILILSFRWRPLRAVNLGPVYTFHFARRRARRLVVAVGLVWIASAIGV